MNRKFRRRYLRERQWKLTVPNTLARKFRDVIGEWDDENDYEIQANDFIEHITLDDWTHEDYSKFEWRL